MSLLIRSWQQSLKSAALCNRMSVSLGSGTEVAGSLVCFGYYVQMNSMTSFQKLVGLSVIKEHFLVDGIRCFVRQLRKGKHGATGYSQHFFYLKWKLQRGFIVYNYSQEYMQKYKLFYGRVDLSLSLCPASPPWGSLAMPLIFAFTIICLLHILLPNVYLESSISLSFKSLFNSYSLACSNLISQPSSQSSNLLLPLF